jgi:hypothetical protein
MKTTTQISHLPAYEDDNTNIKFVSPCFVKMPGCPRRTRKYSRSHTWCQIKIWQKLPVYTETYPSKATRMYKEEERKGLLVWKKRIPQVLRVSSKATRMYVEGMTSLPLTCARRWLRSFFLSHALPSRFKGGVMR